MILRFVIFTILIFPYFVMAQNNSSPRCNNSVQNHELQLKTNPVYKAFYRAYKQRMVERIKYRSPDCSSGPIIIPVAFHYESGVVPAGQEGCAIDLVEDQLASLILELNGNDPQNSVYGSLQNCFPGNPTIGDACVDFCLATQNHPTGYGIVEGDVAVTFGTIDFTIINSGSSAVPFDTNWAGYLNVFVGNLSGGLLGEAAGIPGMFNGEGVVIDACTFGTGDIDCSGMNSSASCGGIYNEGNTLVHEVGHYLGLFHIWGDNTNCTGSQDQIDDTPNMSNNYGGFTGCNDTQCSDLPETCGTKDMYMNYMSYAGDACMYMFTSDQADVVQLTAIDAGFSTSTPAQCALPVLPVADFTWSPEPADICANDGMLYITDMSTGPPTSWAWTFSGAGVTPTSSTIKNPVLTVNTSGNLTATLIATNDIGSSLMVTEVISVTILAASSSVCQNCNYTFELHDADGDGWNGAELNVYLDGSLVETYTMPSGSDETNILNVTEGQEIELYYSGGSYDNEVSFELVDPYSNIVFAQGTNPPDGVLYTADLTCVAPSCTDGIKNGSETEIDCGGSCDPCPICDSNIYDTGGVGGEYENNENETWTLCPDDPADKVRMEFVAFDVEYESICGYDKLSIYNGDGTTDLLGEYCGTTNPPIHISTVSDGCLTIVFTSDNSEIADGWEAIISCVESCSTVTTTNNIGVGSIVEAINCIEVGDTIFFSSGLAGDTIFIDSQLIIIDKDLYIYDDSVDRITFKSNSILTIFRIENGVDAYLEGFDIIPSTQINPNYGIMNYGNLFIKDVNMTNPINGSYILNNGSIIIDGNTTFIK